MIEPTGRLIAWNHAAARTFDLTADEAVGQQVWLLVMPESVDRFQRALRAVRQSGVWRGEVQMSLNSAPRLAEVRLSLGDPPGVPGPTVIAVVSDFTDRIGQRLAARESARWAGARAILSAVIEEAEQDYPLNVDDLRRFGVEAGSAFPARLDRGTGQRLLLAGFRPVRREILAAFLGRNGYFAITESDPAAASDCYYRHRESIRVAIIGPEGAGRPLASELRQTSAFLPIIAVGWQPGDLPDVTELAEPLGPSEFLREVALSVAHSHLAESDPHEY